MLEQLRRNSRSFIIWILFLIIIAAFVLTFGSQGNVQFDGCGGAGSSFVMEVDGTEVPVDSYRYGMRTYNTGGSEEEQTQFVLDKLLEREILAQAASASGFITSRTAASTTAGTAISGSTSRLNPAPSAKKNMMRKKSRSGLRLSATKVEMGDVARATPAMKAPIS